MPKTIEDLNIKPAPYAPRYGVEIAEILAEEIFRAYMAGPKITIKDVAGAFGLPWHATRLAINRCWGSELHYELSDALDAAALAEYEATRLRRTDGKPMCGARTRSGRPCRAPGVGKGGRCRMHGGLSTGPRTEAGRQCVAEAARLKSIERG